MEHLAVRLEAPTTFWHIRTRTMRGTGADVAKFLVSIGESKFPKLAIVHSFNYSGARNIANILNDAGIRVVICRFDIIVDGSSTLARLMNTIQDGSDYYRVIISTYVC